MNLYIANYFWVIFILATLSNAVIWWRRASRRIAGNPQLARGCRRLVLGFAIFGNIPWIVMGLGILSGGVTSVFGYFRPGEANPWVLAWYLTVFVLWGLLLWWVFLGGGAVKLVTYPGLFNFPLTKPKHVKAFALVGLVAGVFGVVLAFRGPMLVPYVTTHGDDGYTTCFVVYDGYWRIVALALLFVSIGTAILIAGIAWIRRLTLPKWWNRKEAGRPAFLLVWSILWLSASIIGFGNRLWRDSSLVGTYRNGTAQIVEGNVHLLHQQPASGHTKGDILEVGGVRLVVDYFHTTPAYTQTVAYGGVLSEGAHVRLWYSDEDILRVDVPQK